VNSPDGVDSDPKKQCQLNDPLASSQPQFPPLAQDEEPEQIDSTTKRHPSRDSQDGRESVKADSRTKEVEESKAQVPTEPSQSSSSQGQLLRPPREGVLQTTKSTKKRPWADVLHHRAHSIDEVARKESMSPPLTEAEVFKYQRTADGEYKKVAPLQLVGGTPGDGLHKLHKLKDIDGQAMATTAGTAGGSDMKKEKRIDRRQRRFVGLLGPGVAGCSGRIQE
jgi:hypothetical protein